MRTRAPADLLVATALRVLPAGSVRERYRRELAAELHDLPAARRLRHALRFAWSAWSLRRAVAGLDPLLEGSAVHPPLHCRLHLYHHHRKASTEDGQVFLACVDCGHLKDNYVDPANPSISSRGLPMG